VRDLFYNVPARKKFLKRSSTEMSHVTDAVARLALANRKVAFKLSSGGRAILDVPEEAEGDPRGRLARILGRPMADHLHPIEPDREQAERAASGASVDGRAGFAGPGPCVTGFVSAPELSERTARGIYTFVNQRYVRDRTIQHAITDAYRTLLERGRYPVVVLFLDVDPRSFDVNVHPQKIEVRFAKTGDIHRAVGGAITKTLAAQPWLIQTSQEPARRYTLKSEPSAPATYAGVVRESPAKHLERFFELVRPIAAPRQLEAELGGKFSSLVPVGQVLATYLVCQGPDRMVVIDQHAAHERIAFEKMRKQRRARALEVQPLLVPLTIELDPARAQIAADEQERLQAIGLELEHFGGSTWLVKTAPTALGHAKLERMVTDVLDELKEIGESTSFDESIDALLSCTACHTVVRAGDRMRNDEISELLRQMDEIDFGAHCPHGRPVFVEWSADALARLFHRT
jgi:DNA mismatch repair protein MutL